MIHKMSSHDFNNILVEANEKIENMNNSISSIKENINKKLLIITRENEYANYCMENLLYKSQQNIENTDVNGSFILLNNNHKGLYKSYSNVVHAFFKKDPINIFNVTSVTTEDTYFRDEVKVSINEVSTDYYKNILKSENNTSKKIFFEEYTKKSTVETNANGESYMKEDNTIVLSIEVDKDKVIGISKFNIIEIDPYLYKSFDIDKIEIFGEDLKTPLFTSNKLPSVGKTRLILDKKYDFKKVVFTITPKYSLSIKGIDTIPFGLKHIYFYEADFRNDSYMIIDYISEEYIDFIKNDIKVITPYGTYNSSIKEQNIKIFLENNNGILENEQEPSLNIKKPIARNLNRLYFRVPIGNKIEGNNNYRNSIIALKLYIETR